MVLAWNQTGPKLLLKSVVTQFIDSYMRKNKSKTTSESALFEVGTVKNNKTVALIFNKC